MLSNLCKTVFLSNFGISSVPSLQRRNKRSVWYAPACSLLLRPQGAKSLPTRWGGGRAPAMAGGALPVLPQHARLRVSCGPGMPGPYGRWPGVELLPGRADMESAPTEGIGGNGNNNEVPRASNARPYMALQFIKTKTPPTLAGRRCLFIKLSD